MKINKYEPRIMRDWFSDAVSSGLGSVGITRDIRDAAQPVIDSGKSLLPKGGAVPQADTGIGSYPQATGFQYNGSVSPIVIAAAAVAGVLILLMVSRE